MGIKGPLLPARRTRGGRSTGRSSTGQQYSSRRRRRPAGAGRGDDVDQLPALLRLRNRLRALEEIVPGSRDQLDAEALLRRTADYIALLELRVSVLRGLSNLYGVL